MKGLMTDQLYPDVLAKARSAMKLTKLVQMLISTEIHGEAERVQIELDERCRREAADIVFGRRIGRHSLLDDNPTSG